MESVDFNKIIALLKKINESRGINFMVNFINFSKFKFEKHWNSSVFPNAYNLVVYSDPEIFTKHYDSIDEIATILREGIKKSSNLIIDKIKITPDYDKFELINSEIRPVYTEWEEINLGQLKLIENLSKSNDSIDLQNIGNSSRTILEKLADAVFDPKRHAPENPSIDTSKGKFKNQLHSYIKHELAGDSNKFLRQFAESSILTVEKSIDLANNLTHKLDAEKIFAEVCIIGTISTISIIKLINKNKMSVK